MYLRSLLTHSSPLADDISVMSTILAYSVYLTYFHSSYLMVNIYPLTCLTYFVFFPFAIFYLSVYCRMRGWSHTLGKAFSKAELSVDVHHPLAHDFTGHINSPGISHLISQLTLLWWWTFVLWHISPIMTYLTYNYFVYAHYYLLSVYLLQDVWTVSHSWQDVQQSLALCWHSSPLADDVSGHVNSPGI